MEEAVRAEMLNVLPRLRRFAYGLTGSRDKADDLTQATCERALREIRRFQAGTRLDSWMYRIARNIHLNDLRSHATRAGHLRVLATREGAEQPSGHGERDMEARLSFAELRGFVARLPEEQRSVLLLVSVEGFSYDEASNILELPAGTIASRIARARATLKAWMDGSEAGTRSPVKPVVTREVGR